MQPTPRTWLLILLALILSGMIAWHEAGDRRASTERTPPPATGGDAYTVDVELSE